MNTRGALKRQLSKDDTCSSLRDSGISISEGVSENELEVKHNPPKKKKKKNNLCRICKKTFRDKKDLERHIHIHKPDVIKPRDKQCHICVKKFRNGTDLRRHLLIHTNEKPHECEICKKAYRQEINLNNHIIMVHTKRRDFKCQFCKKAFGVKASLKLHLRMHTGENPYSCPHCEMKFGQGGQFEKHLATHGKVEKKSCELCFSTFTSERNLIMHMERHEQGPSVTCHICERMFKNDLALKAHLRINHGKVKPECQICELVVEGDMHTHMKSHFAEKSVECSECHTIFGSKNQLIVHMRTHSGEKPFKCRVCSQSFGHKNVLKRHIRKHTGEKPFKCVLCENADNTYVAFSQLCHLKTHMKTIHKKDKTYVCEGCKEPFKVKFQLERHQEFCEKITPPTNFDEYEVEKKEKESYLLSHLRYLVAVLLKKISTEEKLTALGFDKRLIDNVLIASLKVANRKFYQSRKINELERMKLNIQEFLEWLLPENVLDGFKKECPSIENILEMIVSKYLKDN